ncbi:MAG TPA: DUF4412 domain-containing protein [Bacteroides sp.]|nr:DUF4412 domain-containing protein [Bacteroides sp.]
MKKILLIVSILALVIPFREIRAQSLRSIVRNKIVEKVLEDQAEADSVKAVEEGREPDQSPNRTMDDVYLDALGLKGNVAYESNYSFDAYVQMEVSNYEKNGKLDDKVMYDTYFNKGSKDYAMVTADKGDRLTFLFDSRNSAMLMLTDSDGEKTGMAFRVDEETVKEQAEAQQAEGEAVNYKQYKTGKTKQILGYTCEEYLIDDETSVTRMWASEKLGKELRKEMLMNQQAFGSSFHYASGLDGMVMEYDYLDKEDEERVVMQVTGIDMNHSHAISTRNYSVISMRQAVGGQSGEGDTE